MRSIALLIVLMIGACWQPSHAQAQPYVRAVSKNVPMDIYEIVDYTLQCPAGYVPVAYSTTPQYPFDVNEEQGRSLVTPGGAAISADAISAATQLNGAGYSLSVFNTEHHAKILEAMVICVAMAASADGNLQLVAESGSAAKQTTATATNFCPPDAPVAFGGFTSADGRLAWEIGSAPVWGTSASPILLSDVADGQTGPPTGWQSTVFNNFSSNPGFVAYALCGKGPSVQTFVYSGPVPPDAFGFRTPFSVFAPVPDGWKSVGVGYDLGPYGFYSAWDMWMQDGNILTALQWFADSPGYDSATTEARAFIIRGGGNAPADAPGRGVAAVLAIPSGAQAPPTSATIIEYYNATLDHYFITAIPDEITKLDNGTLIGWQRTGQTFNAYGIGSNGRTGRRPVCREYGRPENGLDSHFYSASPDECAASMTNTNGGWVLEASEVFQMDLPDQTSGACPAGDVAIYRIWNGRRDSNHRYTTSPAIRDQMVAKGGTAEGYGPGVVALCGLP